MYVNLYDVKELVKRNLAVVSRNPNSRLCLATDASSLGLGFILAQVKEEFKDLPDNSIRQEHLEILQYGSKAIKNNLAHGSATKREIAAVCLHFKNAIYI
jgi:RNase H-like domain found in reverse transcriptase